MIWGVIGLSGLALFAVGIFVLSLTKNWKLASALSWIGFAMFIVGVGMAASLQEPRSADTGTPALEGRSDGE